MALQSGQTLQQRYRIVSRLGQGGMGAVYRAWDTRLNVAVALKEMLPQPGLNQQTLSQMQEQFRQEATTLARLNHPNLVNVTDFFQEEGRAYLVMRFIEGESLAERIAREGALPEAQVLQLADQLLGALAYCHRHGVLHRDVKPQNVIINAEDQAILVDFGLVKLWNPDDPQTRTVMRGMGTPEYAPPEQYGTRSQHTDPRSDLYSLGATLYHALTGQVPLSASDRMAMPDQFTAPSEMRADLAPDLEGAVLKAMALPLEGRFVSAEEMRASLQRALSRIGTQAKRARIPVWVWVGGVAFLILAVGGGAVLATLLGSGRSALALPTTAARPTEGGHSASSEPTKAATLAPTLVQTATPQQIAPIGEETNVVATATLSPPSLTPTSSSPSPTVTPLATNTTTPTVTPTPTLAYQTLALGASANATQGFAAPPTGQMTLGGVPFNLNERIFQSQAEPPSHSGNPRRVRLDANIRRANRVYLLLTTGNGFRAFANQVVGEVLAYCDGDPVRLTQLTLGQQIREWHGEPNVVSTATQVRQVWQGQIAGADVQGHIDMLTLDLPDYCREGTLTGIEVIDRSSETVNSLDPALNLTGVTVAYYP